MKLQHATAVAATFLGSSVAAADDGFLFHDPQILEADGKIIEVESPGYAAPCLFDLDGDGILDLLVGQMKDGKISLYKGLEADDGSLAFDARQWLRAGEDIVTIPGMW